MRDDSQRVSTPQLKLAKVLLSAILDCPLVDKTCNMLIKASAVMSVRSGSHAISHEIRTQELEI